MVNPVEWDKLELLVREEQLVLLVKLDNLVNVDHLANLDLWVHLAGGVNLDKLVQQASGVELGNVDPLDEQVHLVTMDNRELLVFEDYQDQPDNQGRWEKGEKMDNLVGITMCSNQLLSNASLAFCANGKISEIMVVIC